MNQKYIYHQLLGYLEAVKVKSEPRYCPNNGHLRGHFRFRSFPFRSLVLLGHYLLDISFSSTARMTLEIAVSVVIIDIFLSYF